MRLQEDPLRVYLFTYFYKAVQLFLFSLRTKELIKGNHMLDSTADVDTNSLVGRVLVSCQHNNFFAIFVKVFR